MASKKRGKSEKDLDNINNSLNNILESYKIVPKKEKKTILKSLKSKSKAAKKEFKKTNNWSYKFDAMGFDSRINKIENQTDRIYINYGIFDLHVKVSYLESIKNKEQYLDGLFHRRMKSLLNRTSLDSVKGATEYESLITQYSKKIKATKFYDVELVENSINKLTNYRNKVNAYDYSFFINEKRQRIQGEVYEQRQKNNVKDLEKIIKKSEKRLKKKISKKEEKLLKKKVRESKKEVREINKEINKNYISETKKSIKRQIKNKEKDLLNKRLKDEVKTDIKGDIEDLKDDYLDVENDEESSLIDSEEDTIEQIYKAMEQPITIDGWLMGIQFNFF